MVQPIDLNVNFIFFSFSSRSPTPSKGSLVKDMVKKEKKNLPSYVIEGAATCRLITFTLLDEGSDLMTVLELLRITGQYLN